MKGIIGKKMGMTSIFSADGKQTACTIIEAGPCTVTQVKTQDTDGYTALQLAFGDKKEKHSTKAELKEAILKSWDEIPLDYIRSCIAGLPNKMTCAIEKAEEALFNYQNDYLINHPDV